MPAWIWQAQIDGLSKKYRVIAVDPRSQGESDKPTSGHLPETRALIGWSMGCGELLSYVEQFGEDGIGGLVLVDGMLPAKRNPSVVTVLADWTNQLQHDRQQEADVFVRAMYGKPKPEDYIQRVKQATLAVPTSAIPSYSYEPEGLSE